jgi:O-antigen/teichoic acid export membrane protein
MKRNKSVYSLQNFRKSLIHFLVGRGLGVVTGFILLMALVRALSVEDYGFYVVTQSLLEITTQVSSFGLFAIAQRYLSEMHHAGDGRGLKKLAALLIIGRVFTILIAVVVMYLLFDILNDYFHYAKDTYYYKLFLIVIIFEGIARFYEIIFDSLLLQGVSQVSLVLRSLLRAIPISYLLYTEGSGEVLLEWWIIIDATAALIGVIWCVYNLKKYLGNVEQSSTIVSTPLNYRRYLSYSLPIYVASTLYTVSGINSVKIIASWLLSPQIFAAFGFASAITAMFQRYIPVFLLIGMIRPMFIVARQRDDWRRRLPEFALLLIKLNIFILAPIIIFISLLDDNISVLLSGGRYSDSGGFIVAFMVLIFAQVLRAVASLVAQALENARATLLGTILGLFGLLIGVILSQMYGGYALIIGLMLSELIFSITILKSVKQNNLLFEKDYLGYVKLFSISLLTIILTTPFLGLLQTNTIFILSLLAFVVGAIYLIVSFVLKPFSETERNRINQLIKRKVFIW